MSEAGNRDGSSHVSRRNFLKLGIGAAALASGLLKGSESQGRSAYEQIESDGLKIYLDDQKLPVAAITPDGKTVRFDPYRVREMRDRAVNSDEPEVLDIIRFSRPPSGSESGFGYGGAFLRHSKDIERPKTLELPEDAVSEKILEERGISVIPTDTTKLYIREGAFEDGAPLSYYKNGKRKLTIALLDSPVVAKGVMRDSRYDSVRDMLGDDNEMINRFKKSEIEEFNKWLEGTQNAVLDPKLSEYYKKIDPDSGMTVRDREIFKIKEQLYILQNHVIEDDEVLARMSRDPHSHIIGQYHPSQDSAVIFVATGSPKNYTNAVSLYFTANGELRTEKYSPIAIVMGSSISRRPNISHSYPDPDDFSLNPQASHDDPTSYPYGAQTSGQILRHELAHDELIGQQGDKPNYNEYDTDMKAMEGIRNAWQKWTDSSFADNSGYYFAFSLPEGGYILTSNQSEKGKTSHVS